MNNIKYTTTALTLSNVIGLIDGKNIFPVKKGTRTSDAVLLLNQYIKNEVLMPDIFISSLNVTSSKNLLNLILLNLLGEVNNIFLDLDTLSFKTFTKKQITPMNVISLKRTLSSINWFKLKDDMIKNGFDKNEVEIKMSNGALVIDKLLNSTFILRKNNLMEELDFFKLAN